MKLDDGAGKPLGKFFWITIILSGVWILSLFFAKFFVSNLVIRVLGMYTFFILFLWLLIPPIVLFVLNIIWVIGLIKNIKKKWWIILIGIAIILIILFVFIEIVVSIMEFRRNSFF